MERGTLENHIGAKLADQGVDFQDGAVIRGLEMNEENGPHQVHYRRDGVDHSVQCRWFVDASGRRQLLKRQLGIQQDISHSMNAVWFRLNTRIKIDEFEDLYPLPGPVLDRWISTNHLMGEGYWVWLIPLAGGATSVGIVADPQYHALSSLNNFERALDWLREHQPSVATVVENNRHTLMDFLALKNYAHGCQQVFSPQRWAMTGEAGVFLDPFYSPGSDFIGMSNTLITELILADRRQRPPKAMIEAYNDLYLNLFQNTLTVYRGQYGVFGNPVVMSAKITWDYAAYWCFPALAFCHRRLGQLALDQSSDTILREMGALNSRMQKFFRKWHAIYQPHPVKGMINQGQYELLHALNAELIEPIEDGQAFQKRLAHNLDRLRALAVEMIAVAADNKPELARFASDLEPPAFSVDYAAFHRSIVEPLQAETV